MRPLDTERKALNNYTGNAQLQALQGRAQALQGLLTTLIRTVINRSFLFDGHGAAGLRGWGP